MSYELIAIIVLSVWVIVLTAVLVKVFSVFQTLTKDVKQGNILTLLERVVKKQVRSKKDVAALEKRLKGLEEKTELDVQKIGLVRFNPFKELGGDHSFVLSLLDGKDTGVMITGLHTRERTRVYVKDIEKGKSSVELSAEEKHSLKLAQKS